MLLVSLLLFFLGANSLVLGSECEKQFLQLRAREQHYALSDSRYNNLFVEGRLEGETLSLYIYTKTPSGERSPLIRGKEAFAKVMEHFGPEVKRIKGNWTTSTSEKYGSDNLKTLNELTSKGISIEDAAKETWTGKQAATFGFTQVKKTFSEGSPGQYSLVEVLFTKP